MTHNYGWAIVLVTVAINIAPVPAEAHQPEVVEEDAGAAAADRRHQREVQEPAGDGSEASRNRSRK